MFPAFADINARVFGNFEYRQLDRFLPYHRELGRPMIHNTTDRDALPPGYEAEGASNLRLALQYDIRSLLDPADPWLARPRSSGASYKHIRRVQSYRREDGRPGTQIGGETGRRQKQR